MQYLKSVFPINDYTERATVDYVSYDIGVPKYEVEECSQRGMTFGAPLLVNFRLIVWDIDEEAGTKSVRDIKEQEVYMGDIPLMTKNATFVVNGVERVVVSQMHRSPGVFLIMILVKLMLVVSIFLMLKNNSLSWLLARL